MVHVAIVVEQVEVRPDKAARLPSPNVNVVIAQKTLELKRILGGDDNEARPKSTFRRSGDSQIEIPKPCNTSRDQHLHVGCNLVDARLEDEVEPRADAGHTHHIRHSELVTTSVRAEMELRSISDEKVRPHVADLWRT